MDYTSKLISICKFIVNAIIFENYDVLHKQNILCRVKQYDLLRVLYEYGGKITSIPESAYNSSAFNIIKFFDGTGFHVDLNLWIDEQESDLTLQVTALIDFTTGEITSFWINDILVM